MQGGYNIVTLVELLDDAELAPVAAAQLKHTLLMFDAFHDVAEKAKNGNVHAQGVLQSWADGEWFKNRPVLADKISLRVFKVTGETNTDDLSPAPDAWSRPDIPLHALAMLKMARDGIVPDQQGAIGPMKQIEQMRNDGFPIAYVGDVVGTGSSVNRRPTPCCGSSATTFLTCRTSARAASASAARSHRSSTTPWKTPAPCRSNSMCRR